MNRNTVILLTAYVALLATCIGFGIGDSLLRYEDYRQLFAGADRLQWEVMLTGLAAIAGGYMAYRGATEPAREAKKQIATNHLIAFSRAFRAMRAQLSPYVGVSKLHRKDQTHPRQIKKLRHTMLQVCGNVPRPPARINTPGATMIQENINDLLDCTDHLQEEDVYEIAKLIIELTDEYRTEVTKHL